MILARFLFVFIILALFSFAGKEPNVRAYRISGFAQGTGYHILYYASDSLVTREQTDSIFSKIDSSLSIYKPYSLISQFNRSQTGVEADWMLCEVVRRSMAVNKKSNGAFDITIQPLVQAWGFGAKRVTTLPDSVEIRSLLNCVGPDHIRLNGKRLIKDKPCVAIDVNGIAQGYSVDLVAAHLEKKGIADYLVELGGEIRVKGRKQPSGEKMSVGIESPGDDSDNPLPVLRTIRMDHGAVTTSGNYRKFYQNGSKKITHLIDPKTGYPVDNEMISVTVVAEDAITADAYDNVLMNMGLRKAMKFVSSQKYMHAYFIYSKPDGSVADTASAGFYKMMR
ncbi:FAD:protein FMN transferase [Flavihumibacter sp. R14]|nr:FAD:protein FMN transferase [Flavihumibacter soli]